jgi:hypothetical protein
MILKELDIDEVKEYIKAQSPETKVYLGADSERNKINGEWYADYITAVVVHIDGEHGCKVFGGVKRERDYDQKKNKPAMRLMNEVYSVAEIFEALKDVLEDRYVEVHLDLNPDLRYGSSCVVQQAVGYIKGVCGISPMIKPNSWAATTVADRYKDLI